MLPIPLRNVDAADYSGSITDISADANEATHSIGDISSHFSLRLLHSDYL